MQQSFNKVIDIKNKRTSTRIFPCEWKAINFICKREHLKIKKLLEIIDTNKDSSLGRTYTIRLFTLLYYKNAVIKTLNPAEKNQLTNLIFDTLKTLTK